MGLDMYLHLRIPGAVAPDQKWSETYEYDGKVHESGTYLGDWEHMGDSAERAQFTEIARSIGALDLRCEGSPSMTVYPDGTVVMNVAYWRKANAIHGWFVQNCQNGVDECQESDAIDPEQLLYLASLCKQVLADPSKALEILAPVPGFFFGSYEIDEWYLRDLQDTVDQIERAVQIVLINRIGDGKATFHYQSSW